MDYVGLFEKYLGRGARAGSELAFYCFRCDIKKHKRHLYVNPMTGVYCCYKCMHNPDGYGKGNAMTFARLMGETERVESGWDRSKFQEEEESTYNQVVATRVYTYLRDKLTLLPEDKKVIIHNRGIKRPENFGVRSCNGASSLLMDEFSKEELVASGLFFLRGNRLMPHGCIRDDRVVIPYVSRATGDVPFIRTRALGEGLKYMSPKDSKASKRIWGCIPNDSKVMVVTEGEFKAMAAVENKILTVGLPGMGVSHQALIDQINGSGLERVILCFDSQKHAAKEVEYCINALSGKLLRGTKCRIFQATLPLEDGIESGEKMDIDTFLYYHSRNDLIDVLRSAKEVEL